MDYIWKNKTPPTHTHTPLELLVLSFVATCAWERCSFLWADCLKNAQPSKHDMLRTELITWTRENKAHNNCCSNMPLFMTARLERETPRTIAAGECMDSVFCLAPDDHLFICFESTAVWQGYVTYPCSYSLCQVGIKVINASSDRCWKVSLKHERTSVASVITHYSNVPSLHAHVCTLYGFIFTNGRRDIL